MKRSARMRFAGWVLLWFLPAALPAGQIAGVVRDARGEDVPSGKVYLLPDGEPCSTPEEYEAALLVDTVEDGLFLLELPESQDSAWVAVSAPGFAPGLLGRIAVNGDPTSVTLRAATFVAGRLRVAREGAGVPDATVVVLPHVPENRTDDPVDPFLLCAARAGDSPLVRKAPTGEDGTFHVDGLSAGLVDLEVEAPRNMDIRRQEILVPREGRQDLDLVSPPAAAVAGTVKDVSGKPLAGIEVMVVPSAGEGGRRGTARWGRRNSERKTETDESGQFRIEDIPVDTPLTLSARGLGRVPVEEELSALQQGAVRRVELRMRPGTTVSGRVVDETGEGVSGALVQLGAPEDTPAPSLLNRARRFAFAFQPAEQTQPRSGPMGDFVLEGVSPGEWQVQVVVSGMLRDTDRTLEVPKEGLEDVLVSVKLGPAVRGTVTDDLGAPLVGAQVRARTGQRLDTTFFTEETDFQGRFVLRANAPDTALNWLEVRKEGYEVAVRENVAPGGEELVIVLSRGGGLEGSVVGPDGGAVPAFRVRAVPRRDTARPRGARRDTVQEFYDEMGRWAMDGVPPGTWDIIVESQGLAPGRQEDVTVASGQVTTVPAITLSEGRSLKGTVIDSQSGLGIRGARVSLSSGGPGGRWQPTPAGLGADVAETDASGAFELHSVPAGVHTLEASHPNYPTATQSGVRVTEEQEMAPVVIRMSPGGSIEGVAARAGVPIVGARVQASGVRWGGDQPTGITDSSGQFRFAALAAGRWTVSLTEEGRQPRWKNVQVREGEVTRVEFADEEFGAIRGRVHRASSPVEGANLVLFPSARGGTTSAREARTGPDGGFQFDDLVAGDYRLMVVPPGASGPSGTPERISVGAGDQVERDIELPSLPLQGVVTDSLSGEPVRGANVLVTTLGRTANADSGSRGSWSTATDSGGGFRLDIPAEGGYRILINHADYVRKTEEVMVPATGLSDVSIEMESSRTLKGRLLDEEGLPVVRASVQMVGGASRTWTDDGGRFVLAGLPDTPVTVRFIGAGVAPKVVANVRSSPEEQSWIMESGGALVVQVRAAPPILKAGRLSVRNSRGEDVGSPLLSWAHVAGVDNRLRTDGFVRFPHLDPDVYTVSFTAAGGGANTTVQVLRGGEVTALLEP